MRHFGVRVILKASEINHRRGSSSLASMAKRIDRATSTSRFIVAKSCVK